MLSDEFEKYDSCTADTLEIGDLILLYNPESKNDEFIEVHSSEFLLGVTVSGYSYNQDLDVVIPNVDPDTRLDLYKIA